MKAPLNKRTIVCALLFSFLFSIAFYLGKSMYNTNDIASFCSSTDTLVGNIVAIVVTSVILGIIVSIIYSFPSNIKPNAFSYKKCHFFVLWLVFFIFWIPAFIAYYPGIWSYDIGVQIWQTAGNYNTYHPPIQTFILDLFIRISKNDYAKAVSLYALFQMLLLSAVFSYTVCYFIKKQYSKILVVGSVIFYSLNPVIAIFATIPVKDVLCGAVLVPLVLENISLISSPDSYLCSVKNIVRYTIIVLLFCLLRNNAIYALLVSTPFFFFIKTNKRFSLCILLIVPIVLYFFSTSVVYPLLGIEKARGSEMFSVPLQQIANVVANTPDSLSDADRDAINQFLPYDQLAEIYNPRFADPVRFVYNGAPGSAFMLKEWLHLLPGHLKEYVNAFISLNIPMWYPNANAKDPFSGAQYIETNVTYHNVGAPFVNANLSPTLLKFYESIATYSSLEALPQILNIFSLSFSLWLMLFSFFKLISIKKSAYIISFAIPFFFWATYLLCPVSSMRYLLPSVMLYPVFFSFLFFDKKA